MSLLLGCGLPDTVPVFRRGGSGKGGDAGQKFERGAVIFANFEAILEGFFSLSPLLLSVKLKGDGVGVAQLKSGGGQFSDFAEEFIDTNRLRLAVHGDKVDFPRFDITFGEAIAVLIDDEVGPIDFVHALESGGDIDGVPNDGERFCRVRADRTDEGIPGGQGHTDMKLRNVSAEACDLGYLLFNLRKGRAHFEAGEASIECVGFSFREGIGPEGHDGIPDELVHDSVMLTDAGGGGGKVVIEESDNIVSGELLSDSAKAGDIGEKDGNFSSVG